MRTFFGAAALAVALSFGAAAQAQFLIIGNDEKVAFDDGNSAAPLSFSALFPCDRSAPIRPIQRCHKPGAR